MKLILTLFFLLMSGFSGVIYVHAESDSFVVKEWDIPTKNSAPHDIVVGSNRLVWFTEINANKIGMFNPDTEEFKEYPIPTPSSGPHGLVVDKQGNVWFTEVNAGKIGKLDPQTGVIEEFVTPTPNSGPHTPIFADDHTLWFTEQRASKIGKLDLTGGTIHEFPTLTESANPYGIITDTYGNAWFAELRGHNIGRVDALTGEVTEYPMATDGSGPRRIAIDSNGILWITQYNVGKISSFDPKTGEVIEYNTSSESSGPYAISVDPFDNVWFSMTGIYRIGMLNQTTQKILEHDMPSPETHIKFIHSDNNGNIWFPNYNNNKIGVVLRQTTLDTENIPSMHDSKSKDSPMPKELNLSPLKQVQSKIEPVNVTCNTGLELVLKSSNGQPACVKSGSVAKLLERGWAIHILPDYEIDSEKNSTIFSTGNFKIETATVQYFKDSQGYIAKPSDERVFPGIIMIHEFWGLNENIKDMAEKLASHGYVVLAVDLYEGKVGTTTEEARQLQSSFEQSQWTENMNSAVSFLEKEYNISSLGSIGWCFGGGQSLNLALNNDDMDATVIYYGSLNLDREQLASINWPILGIFAGLDQGITQESVNQFQVILDDLGIENEIHIYPDVNHAFANPSGERYAPDESRDAWTKTLAFFAQNLK